MFVQDVVAALERLQDSRGPHVSLRGIAAAAGLSHMTIYRALRSGDLSFEVCESLTPVLRKALATGQLSQKSK